MLDKSLGILIFVVGMAHFLYLFIGHKRSTLMVVDILAILFGAALWQYPEKVNEILGFAEKAAPPGAGK
jgi:hypothetical protein